MKVAAQARQITEGVLQIRGWFGGTEAGLIGGVDLLEPADQLEVAETAGSLLDIGLQVIEGAGELGVALPRQSGEVADQRLAVGLDEARQAAGEVGIERAVAGKETLIEQADVELDIPIVHLGALGRRAHGLADAQSGVPESLEKYGDEFLRRRAQPVGLEQQQKVDIGVGKQVAAAVATHGQQGDAGLAQQGLGGLHHKPVHLVSTLGQSGDGDLRFRES